MIKLRRGIRASLLSALVIISTLTVIFSVPPVGADSTEGRTDLYFTEYQTIFSSFLSEEDTFSDESEYNITSQMNLNSPTKEEDSVWPPSLFVDNESRLLPDINFEDYLVMFLMWAVYTHPELIENMTEDLDLDLFGLDLFETIDFELVNPFKVNEDFTFTNEENIILNGDITFDLYFSSKSKIIRKHDQVEVTLSKATSFLGLPFPIGSEEIINQTETIQPVLLPNSIVKQQITLDLSSNPVTIEPGDTLRFSVELIPFDKTNIIMTIGEILGFGGGKGLIWLAEKLSNSPFDLFQGIGEELTYYLSMANMTEEYGVNVSLFDFLSLSELSNLVDAMQGSSFIFASNAHPSRVIIPIQSTYENENLQTYYLHSENNMDTVSPNEDSTLSETISETAVTWQGPDLSRSKILQDATASLYINARTLLNLRKITVKATLTNNEQTIATSSKELSFDLLLTSPTEPITFPFTIPDDTEITYDDNLQLSIALANNSKMLGRKANLLYGSSDAPSNLQVTFSETDNIKIQDFNSIPKDQEIIPGGQIIYTLNISSKYQDTIDIEVTSEQKLGKWDIDIEDEQITIQAGKTKTVNVTVTSENKTKDGYENYNELLFTISGNTGKTTTTSTVDVTEDAKEYDVQIVSYTKDKEIPRGENGTIYFIIKNNNTGATDDKDSYTITVESQNKWVDTENSRAEYNNLQIGETTDEDDIWIVLTIPENTTLTKDILTFTITSKGNTDASATVNVTIKVAGLNIFEMMYDFFESLSKDLGLEEVFGEDAPLILAIIIMIIILFIVIIIALIVTTKYTDVICIERIKEITADETAHFEITVKNPKKKTYDYEITKKHSSEPQKWETKLDTTTITLPSKEQQTIHLSVTPTEYIKVEDSLEVQIMVKPHNRRKTEKINTMTIVKSGSSKLQITDVFNWPKIFKPKEKVTTSFKIQNNANTTAHNVSVFLYINDEQKNKVEDITIPPGGFAEIRMPWIAKKGENKLRIKIR